MRSYIEWRGAANAVRDKSTQTILANELRSHWPEWEKDPECKYATPNECLIGELGMTLDQLRDRNRNQRQKEKTGSSDRHSRGGHHGKDQKNKTETKDTETNKTSERIERDRIERERIERTERERKAQEDALRREAEEIARRNRESESNDSTESVEFRMRRERLQHFIATRNKMNAGVSTIEESMKMLRAHQPFDTDSEKSECIIKWITDLDEILRELNSMITPVERNA